MTRDCISSENRKRKHENHLPKVSEWRKDKHGRGTRVSWDSAGEHLAMAFPLRAYRVASCFRQAAFLLCCSRLPGRCCSGTGLGKTLSKGEKQAEPFAQPHKPYSRLPSRARVGHMEKAKVGLLDRSRGRLAGWGHHLCPLPLGSLDAAALPPPVWMFPVK